VLGASTLWNQREQWLKQRERELKERCGMSRYTQALAGKSLMNSRIVWPVAILVATAGCGTPDPPVSYPCKNPDPGHLGPEGKPDPCHFEDPSSPAQAVTTFFSAVAGPFCEALYACCADQMFLQDFAGGTLDTCKTLWANGSGLGSRVLLNLKASLVNGQTAFDPAQMDACVARLTARLVSPPAGTAACLEPTPFLLLNTCLGAAFQGQVAPGDACDPWPSLPEDLSFTVCKAGRCDKGKCVSFLKAGDACYHGVFPSNATDVICNFIQDEWCNSSTDPGICAPRVGIGDACSYSNRNYECKSLDCKDHVCGPLLPDSNACDVF
jgi:hypothetical protein